MKRGVEVLCSGCGQRNRVPYPKIGAQGKCGRCRAVLPSPSRPVAVDLLEDLQEAIATASVPVVVDFWAEWCGPCRAVAPAIEALAARHAGEWLVLKANTEPDPRLGSAYTIRSIPTLAIFRDGRELGRDAGARPLGAIESLVEQTLARHA